MRVGTGYDLHRLEPGRKLLLGGVTIPHDKGLVGHSDADVLSHAIIDALFGAANLGNIGQHFPDTDEAYRDADSLELLARAHALVRERGYSIVNIDTTVVAQAPQLNPHLAAIAESIATALGLDPDVVSVKAKTNEGVGPEGRGEAISVHAIALIQRSP